MRRRIVLLVLNMLLVEPVLAEIDLSALPADKAQSLQNNLQMIQAYFDQIKKAANSGDNSSIENANVLGESLAELERMSERASVATEKEARIPKASKNSASRRYASRLSTGQRDPFAITPRMFEGDPTLQDLGLNFQPDTELEIPEIKLKGVVNGTDGKIAALVDVEDVGVIVVREGDTIGVRTKDGGGLRVRKISRTGLILTAGSLGRDVIVK